MERRKIEVNHKTFEVLSILACFLFLIGLAIWGFDLPEPASPEQRAKQYAKVLGYSVWQLDLNRTPPSNTFAPKPLRGIASSDDDKGEIGRDPWGNAYTYAFRRDQQLLFIWSFGPNGKNDSNQFASTFQGDDLGFILDLKLRQ